MRLFGSIKELVSAVFRKDTYEITLRPNQSTTYTAARDVQLPAKDGNAVLVSSGDIVNADINASAAIADTKLAAISTAGKVSNSATTATDANTPSAIVARDASGNFSAGTITASLSGNADTATTATSFSGSLSGEVTGTQSATVIASGVIDNDNIAASAGIVDTKLATISTAGKVANSATSATTAATPATIVLRDGSGNISGAQVSGNISGNAANVTGTVAIANGGSGQTTANAALNAFLPSQGSSAGKYLKTDGTNTSWAAASGGAGEINAVLNASGADGTTGYSNNTAGNHTVSALTSGSPLDPAIPTGLRITATANVTESGLLGSSGVYYSMVTMPASLRNRKLKLEFYLTSPLADTWKVSVYKDTTRIPLSTDSGGSTSLPAGFTGKFTAYFDTDNTVPHRVIWSRTAGTGTTNLDITNVIVGPGIQPQGAVVGEWTSYTPTSQGFGTLAAAVVQFQRIGTSARVLGYIQAGTPTAVEARIGLPNSITNLSGSGNIQIGRWWIDSGSGNTRKTGSILLTIGSSYVRFSSDDYATASFPGTALNGNVVAPAVGQFVNFDFTAPIAEWAGSGTVQLAQNDVEYASNSGNVTAAGGSDTTSFAYGPSGSPILSYNSTTVSAVTSFTVQFQTPIQSGDQVVLELSSDGLGWTPVSIGNAGTVSGLTFQSNAIYGAGVRVTSATQAIVEFGNAGRVPTGGVYAAVAASWSGATTYKWRVRKSSAGAAVGFGLVVPGTSAGLVSASGLPGNTTGNAIASGYVGEDLGTANAGSAAVSSNVYNTVISKTLTAGVYLISGSAKLLSSGATYSSDLFVVSLGFGSTGSLNASVDDTSGATGWNEKTIHTPTITVRCDGTNLYTPGGTITGTTLNLLVYPGVFTGSMNVSHRQLTIVRIA